MLNQIDKCIKIRSKTKNQINGSKVQRLTDQKPEQQNKSYIDMTKF